MSPHRVVGVPGLDAQLGQDPDAVGEFEGLVEHVLPLHVPLGYGVDIVVLQFAGDSVFGRRGEKAHLLVQIHHLQGQESPEEHSQDARAQGNAGSFPGDMSTHDTRRKKSSSLHEPTSLPSGCDLLVSICPFYRALTALDHSGLDQGEVSKAAQTGRGLCCISTSYRQPKSQRMKVEKNKDYSLRFAQVLRSCPSHKNSLLLPSHTDTSGQINVLQSSKNPFHFQKSSYLKD